MLRKQMEKQIDKHIALEEHLKKICKKIYFELPSLQFVCLLGLGRYAYLPIQYCHNAWMPKNVIFVVFFCLPVFFILFVNVLTICECF